ncbi:unnamed protein product [Paramecium octaurelia]|uniref:Tetratricopeptide repeat protein n=1 Tax=Paramecium octaurelia TaxID=43137 RepID=A0A8S1WZX4_PAROT|nr:unnamed protein product [Paramecium octaurelia]
MNQSEDFIMKCPNPQHTKNLSQVCFDEFCKEQRLCCHECIQSGKHFSHPHNLQELPFLFEHIEKTKQQTDNFINKLNTKMDYVYQFYSLLIGGIRSKYQMSKIQFLTLNFDEIDSFVLQIIHFKSFELYFQKLFQQFILKIQDFMKELQNELDLTSVKYYQISKFNLMKSEEYYKKGYKLYWDDKKFDEAINLFDQALNLNQQHLLSLWCKADSLRILGQYNESTIWALQFIIYQRHKQIFNLLADILRLIGQYHEAVLWADRALSVDPNHFNSLFTKADSLRILGQYDEAVIWADKALLLNPKQRDSLCTKAESLRGLGQYDEAIISADQALQVDPKHCSSLYIKEAMKVIETSLKINPTHFDSLKIKGACLQDQSLYKEALIFYDKALKIDSNNQWTKKRKNECLNALKNK